MDQAFGALAAERLAPALLHADWVLVQDHDLSPVLCTMTQVWQAPD